MHDDSTESRSQQHAKILTYINQQVLVFLHRDSSEKLQVLVQVWSRSSDHQVRALVDVETDDQAMVAFDSFTDETIGQFIEAAGIDVVL
jgi:hypothetical protein